MTKTIEEVILNLKKVSDSMRRFKGQLRETIMELYDVFCTAENETENKEIELLLDEFDTLLGYITQIENEMNMTLIGIQNLSSS